MAAQQWAGRPDRAVLRSRVSGCAAVALVACVWLSPALAHAWVLQMPAKAEFATLPQGRVLCGPTPEGFLVDASRRRIRPRQETAPGHNVTATLAQHSGACATDAREPATLIVTGELPSFGVQGFLLEREALDQA